MDKTLIREHIQANELKAALEALVAHAREARLREWERELIGLARRFRENQDLHRQNLITSEVWSVNETRIAQALLEILDHLEEGTPGPTQKERQALQEALPEAPRSPFRTFAGIALALTQVIALLGVWLFWELGGMPNRQFALAVCLTMLLPPAAGYAAGRLLSFRGGSATPLQAFLFLLTLLLYALGVYFFMYQKSVGGLFGESFYAMHIAIAAWCLLFGVFAAYWMQRFFSK